MLCLSNIPSTLNDNDDLLNLKRVNINPILVGSNVIDDDNVELKIESDDDDSDTNEDLLL